MSVKWNRKRRPSRWRTETPSARKVRQSLCPHCGHLLFINDQRSHWPERCPARGMEAAR